ncbi:hypothetical protein K469DRAFT_599151 [Zopfia rhizophila CBS 207.26]|uniref:Uncharacterized protein n=1 Tax=Zopfia rhizophila CBS 207.26 TaxID=1314779 RepID=A0A6A6DJL3_9PEZI|nr:hypothetical protein K469DRAFT_599151 [Zopfia rhizophila CBS 207.26]
MNIPKVLFAGGAVGFTYYLFMRQYWFPNPYKTREVQNVEDKFTAGGATPTYTPGAGTRTGIGIGDTHNVEPRQTDNKGVDSSFFKDRLSDQKSEPGIFPEKFYEQHYNNPKSK